MPVQKFGPADFNTMPWKNGGGTTCELYRLSHPQRANDFALRLSIAQVAQGGPFSAFPGIDRTLMLLSGQGMALRIDGAPDEARLDTPLAPIHFPGEAPVDCRLLGGPLQDFNVMVARDWGRATTQIVHLTDGERYPIAASLALFYIHHGQAQLGDVVAAAGELLLHTGDTPTALWGVNGGNQASQIIEVVVTAV